MKKGQFEGQLLLLITLALVAFGLVMVFSATSGQATLGNGDASYYLRKQGLYALVGIVLLVLLRRTSYRSLRPLAPTLLVGSLGLLLAVLAIGTTVNGAKRWLQFGPAVFQPSELAKLALVIWLAAYLSRHPAPRTLGELFKPIGLVVGVFCALFLAEPDLGTAITVVVMLGGVLVVSGAPARLLGSAGALAVGLVLDRRLVRAVQARAAAELHQSLGRPAGRRLPDRPGDDRARLRRDLRGGARRGDLRRTSTSRKPTRT